MTPVQEAELHELLEKWHGWQKGEKLTEGHARCSAVSGGFKISRQYDDANGALDSDLDAFRSRQVDHEVGQMVDPHKTAIYMLARNLSTGAEVWLSPRLPDNWADRVLVVGMAKTMLVRRLERAGVL